VSLLLHAAFVDSQGWMAIINRRDQGHEAASEAYRELTKRSWKLYTSNWTMYDALSHLKERAKSGGYAAARALEELARPPAVIVMPVTKEIERRAVARFWRMADKAWSITSCANMEIMQDASLRYVLSASSAYQEAGYVSLVRLISAAYDAAVP
jgi:predicted nucleic acid-binding protein